MKISEIKKAFELLPDDTEVLCFDKYNEVISPTYELTIDTNMRTGETVLIVCKDDTEAGNLRDFEPHPGFEDFNQWQHEE